MAIDKEKLQEMSAELDKALAKETKESWNERYDNYLDYSKNIFEGLRPGNLVWTEDGRRGVYKGHRPFNGYEEHVVWFEGNPMKPNQESFYPNGHTNIYDHIPFLATTDIYKSITRVDPGAWATFEDELNERSAEALYLTLFKSPSNANKLMVRNAYALGCIKQKNLDIEWICGEVYQSLVAEEGRGIIFNGCTPAELVSKLKEELKADNGYHNPLIEK